MRWAVVIVAVMVAVVMGDMLPTTCYQGDRVLFSDGGSGLCAGGGACHVSWQAQVDWSVSELLHFEVRLDDADQCLSSYGLPLKRQALCETTGYGSAEETTLVVQLAGYYHGGSVAAATYHYRGANLSCAELASTPSALDASLVSHTFDVVLGEPATQTLTQLEPVAMPLSAAVIECPLLPLHCVCQTGCAYPADVWARHYSDSLAWERADLPDSICGLAPVQWVARTKPTASFPAQVVDAIAAYVGVQLNSANFACVHPAVTGDAGANAVVLDAWEAIRAGLVYTRSASQDCYSLHEWAPQAAVLTRYNDGQFANASGPCSCRNRECAARYVDGAAEASGPSVDASEFLSGLGVDADLYVYSEDDQRETAYFWSMIAAGTCCLLCTALVLFLVCCLGGAQFIGPRGFRAIGGEMIATSPDEMHTALAAWHVPSSSSSSSSSTGINI